MHVGIVGGGILGMNVAKLCRQAGYEVTLVEAEPELGGLLRSIEVGGVVVDRFYHVINPTDFRLLALIEELGLKNHLQWKTTQTGFYANGTLHPMNNLLQFLTFKPLSVYERVRLGMCVFWAGQIRDWRQLEAITATDWFSRLAGKQVTEKIWNPLLQSKFAEYWDKVNAAYMWGTINRFRASRTGAAQKEALGCMRGGYAPFLRAMHAYLEKLGVSIRTGTAVQRIAAAHNGGARLECQDTQGAKYQFTFDKLVSTLPQTLFNQVANIPQSRRTAFDTLGIIEGLLLLKKPLSPYYVINITDRSIPFTGIIEYTNVANSSDYQGMNIVFISRYVMSESKDFDISDKNMRLHYLDNMKKMFPYYNFDKNVHAFEIMRTRYLQPVHNVHYSQKIPPVPTHIKNVYSVNSVHINPWPVFSNETLELSHDVFETYLREREQERGGRGSTRTCG
jgi:protoporphyrinogen oxidase